MDYLLTNFHPINTLKHIKRLDLNLPMLYRFDHISICK